MKLNWMLKNSKGIPDGSWSLAVFSWFIVSFCIVLPVIGKITIKDFVLDPQAPDTTLLLGFMTTTLGNYLLRRNKKDTTESKGLVEQAVDEATNSESK